MAGTASQLRWARLARIVICAVAVPDDPYTRLQALAARGRLTRAVAAHEQLERDRVTREEPRQNVAVKPERRHEVSWDRARDVGAQREAGRDFDGALAIYSSVRRTPADRVELDIAMARCCVELARPSAAHTHACDALVEDPRHPEALALRTRALALANHHVDALASADDWLARAPQLHAHYARGRALFALRRFVEARDAFERANELPEALLMRREVDRCMMELRATVGVDAPIELVMPDD
jgi:tetratricopeptide (TPR) repeat protein